MKRLRQVLSLMILTAAGWMLWTMAVAAAPRAETPDPQLERITGNLMCTCGCPHQIRACGDECGIAPQLVAEIKTMLKEGKTEQQVYAAFEKEYGPAVLAAPKAEGFDLLAWVLPFVGLGLGLVVVFVAVKKLRTPLSETGKKSRQEVAIDPKYRELIDQELRR